MGQTVRTSGEMLICNDVGSYREGLGIEGMCLSTAREKLRSGAGQNELAVDQVLANFVAELFVILQPATLPTLERMFEDVKQDAETDGEWGLKRRAEIGIAAARIAARELEAIEN
jgi:hypothetical protein